MYVLIKLYCSEEEEHLSVVMLEQRQEERKKRKAYVAIRDLISMNEYSAIEVVESPPPKKRNKSESRKKKVIVSLISWNQVIHGNGDVETPGIRRIEDDPLVLGEVEEETFESCLVGFGWLVLRGRDPIGKKRLPMRSRALIRARQGRR